MISAITPFKEGFDAGSTFLDPNLHASAYKVVKPTWAPAKPAKQSKLGKAEGTSHGKADGEDGKSEGNEKQEKKFTPFEKAAACVMDMTTWAATARKLSKQLAQLNVSECLAAELLDASTELEANAIRYKNGHLRNKL